MNHAHSKVGILVCGSKSAGAAVSMNGDRNYLFHRQDRKSPAINDARPVAVDSLLRFHEQSCLL